MADEYPGEDHVGQGLDGREEPDGNTTHIDPRNVHPERTQVAFRFATMVAVEREGNPRLRSGLPQRIVVGLEIGPLWRPRQVKGPGPLVPHPLELRQA